MFKNRKRKGFTLIELVIVIAIIGILIAIAIPRFADATQGAKNRKIDAAARTIASGMAQYYANNLKWPVSTDTDQKNAILNGAGITDATEQGRWAFEHQDATGTGTSATPEQIIVTYTWGTTGDVYSGSIGKLDPTTNPTKAIFTF